MLVNDHTKLGTELNQIAKDKKITLPALSGMAEMRQADRLAMKQGNDFDKVYMDAMIMDEKKHSIFAKADQKSARTLH